jgi:hypothetical protein
MDDIVGYALAERWEELAERFKPPSDAAITVTLTADEAQEVHEAMTAAVAALVAEIEADKAAGRPPLG